MRHGVWGGGEGDGTHILRLFFFEYAAPMGPFFSQISRHRSHFLQKYPDMQHQHFFFLGGERGIDEGAKCIGEKYKKAQKLAVKG